MVAALRCCCRWRWTLGQFGEERPDGWSRDLPDPAAGEPGFFWHEVGDRIGFDDPALGEGLGADEGGQEAYTDAELDRTKHGAQSGATSFGAPGNGRPRTCCQKRRVIGSSRL